MKHREIIYNGKSAIRSTYNSLGTQMDDYTQHGYEQYHSHEDYQLMYLQEGKAEITINDISHIYSPRQHSATGSQSSPQDRCA